MKEHRGKWQQVSQCRECGWVVSKDTKWMDPFFVPVCPDCGAHNVGVFGSDLFDSYTARPVRGGLFRRFLRWEFKD